MKTQNIPISTAQLACEIYGSGKISLVIEMGLGAVMAEWRQLAEKLSGRHTVLLYQRAGYGASGASTLTRTPENIVSELRQLLEQVEHTERITFLAHSQGGLYAWKFVKMYPDMAERLVLLDPLSPEDYRFRMELTDEEFRKSGADKTAGLQLNLRLTRLHLGWLVSRMMRTAPPFYYYNGFSREQAREILSAAGKSRTYQTALAEYEAAHDADHLTGLLDKESFPKIPVTVITHSSDIAVREIREFGGASQAQAEKIEALWQRLMQSYLACAGCGTLLRAEHSSHYIHLTDPDLVCGILE